MLLLIYLFQMKYCSNFEQSNLPENCGQVDGNLLQWLVPVYVHRNIEK